jgi:hypothetical protein
LNFFNIYKFLHFFLFDCKFFFIFIFYSYSKYVEQEFTAQKGFNQQSYGYNAPRDRGLNNIPYTQPKFDYRDKEKEILGSKMKGNFFYNFFY